jgi:uncharacterized glyoxalase superfamily protein PhnB
MKVKSVPEGFGTVTPYFSVRGAHRFIGFLKQAFDAKDVFVATLPDGSLLSAEVQVGNSMVVVGEEDPGQPPNQRMRANLYMYVDDVDAVFHKAVRAGARSIEEPEDQFWGDRSGVIEDVAGNRWWIATHKEELSAEELIRRAIESE